MRFGGELIHQSRDDHGTIEIVQSHTIRTLHFGTPARQSAMQISEPKKLILSYTRALLAGLLFNPKPRSTLFLGLGGGSIPKFMRHHFSNCRLDAVELREQVVKLAHRFFYLPKDDGLLQTTTADAGHFVSHADIQHMNYDLLIIDINAPTVITNPGFFSACRTRLANNGILTINLWDKQHPATEQALAALNNSFKNEVLLLPVDNNSNLIAIALKQSITSFQKTTLQLTADQLQHQCDIEFSAILTVLLKGLPE